MAIIVEHKKKTKRKASQRAPSRTTTRYGGKKVLAAARAKMPKGKKSKGRK
jgi:hypothetical protein